MAAYAVSGTLARWWAAKPDSERRIALALALITAMAVAWLAAWQPVTRDIAAMKSAQPQGKTALADAQRMVDEIAGLARSPTLSGSGDRRAEIEQVLTNAGLRTVVTQMDTSDDRTRIAFSAVAFDRLLVALETLQTQAHLRVVDATFTARIEPGMVRAELTLGR